MIQTTADGFMGLHLTQRQTDVPTVVDITAALRRFDSNGDSLNTLFKSEFTLNVLKMGFEGLQANLPLYTQDDQGRIWQCRARADLYEINVYNPSGTIERVVEKDFEPIRKTEQELADEQQMIQEMLAASGAPPEISFESSPNKPAIGLIYYDPRGYIWVAVSREEELTMNAFDLFDMEGQFLTQLELPGVSAPGMLVFEGDKVYVPEGDPGEIPQVIVYRVTIGN
jgi:hypothetical protein